MKITFITLGSPNLSFAKEGITEYTKRISRFCDFSLVHIKEDKRALDKILKISEKKFVILFDEKGKQFSSQAFSLFLDKRKMAGQDICFIIGGPEGHVSEIRERGNFFLSLSCLTLPHDLAMMFGIEAIYRSLSILENHPYHRE